MGGVLVGWCSHAGGGACVSSLPSPSQPVPSCTALLMLEENICSMSSFPPGRCLAASPWKMALCQSGVGGRRRGWSRGSMLAPHRVLGLMVREIQPPVPQPLAAGLSPIFGASPCPARCLP